MTGWKVLLLTALLCVLGQAQAMAETPDAAAAHYYTITLTSPVNGHKMCLDAAAGSYGDRGKVQIWECNGRATQKWYSIPDNGYSLLMNGQSLGHSPQYCLQYAYPVGNGDRVQVATCNDVPHEAWDLPSAEYPHMRPLVGGDSSFCLDADANHLGNGDRAQLWRCNNQSQQTWEKIYH